MNPDRLAFVLVATPPKLGISIEHLNSDAVKRLGREWIGAKANDMRKDKCVEALGRALLDPGRAAEVVDKLAPNERAVLSVVKRFGGIISGELLYGELLARGLVKARDRKDYHWKKDDPVDRLRERWLLLSVYNENESYFDRVYSNVALLPTISGLILPAPALSWRPSVTLDESPSSVVSRAPSEFMVELSDLAHTLKKLGSWKVNQGGVLSSSARNRLVKLFPVDDANPLLPADRLGFTYTMLCALGVVDDVYGEASIESERMESIWLQSIELQAFEWVRAWLRMRVWQDGVGSVPDRDGRETYTRINPPEVRRARQILIWSLTRIAQGPNHWLELESFLGDLFRAAEPNGLSLYWSNYFWNPRLVVTGGNKLETSSDRERAHWFTRGAVWTANALLCTLVHIGLVERGCSDSESAPQWCFRLTELGRAVFGAPEVQPLKRPVAQPCLAVQPNYEIILYVDSTDGSAVTTLGRLAQRVSAVGMVRVFKLTRDSVYAALESGMTHAQIESFLATSSRNGLPDNVAQSLSEWARKRESIVVRRDVALTTVASGETVDGRPAGERFIALSPQKAAARAQELQVEVETINPSNDWTLDEQGAVTINQPLSVIGQARLQRIAQRESGVTWRITAETVSAARRLGISAEMVQAWLDFHTRGNVPPLLTAAVRNWAGSKRAMSLSERVLLEISDLNAYQAVLGSPRLSALIDKSIAPGYLLVHADKRDELQRLLIELGFNLDPVTSDSRTDRSIGSGRKKSAKGNGKSRSVRA
jgi:hypothetical protein